jgi:hypothetical protein
MTAHKLDAEKIDCLFDEQACRGIIGHYLQTHANASAQAASSAGVGASCCSRAVRSAVREIGTNRS